MITPGSDLLRKSWPSAKMFSRLQNTIRRPGQILLVLFFFIFILYPSYVHAVDCETFDPKTSNNPGELTECSSYYSNKLGALSGQAKTLAQALSILNTQIKLTQAKISTNQNQLDKLGVEITDLSSRISSIDYSLTDLTKLFIKRVKETYMYRSTFDAMIIAQTSGIGDAMRVIEYTKKVRDHDRNILITLEKSRLDFDTQKQAKEQKQQEIEALKKKLNADKAALAGQVSAKNQLLAETKNSEEKYQSLLSQVLAELEAINEIIAGKGVETEVGTVTENQRIASIIQSESCNSSAAHLHFIVSKSGTTQNPFNYLSSADHDNCSGSSCGSGDGDAFNPSGSWSWPISPRIKLNQGYGSTWAVHNTWVGGIYKFHNGIDINSESSEVKAVQAGVLYRGSYIGSKGCNLRYVRVDHKDTDLDTFYLHVNY